MRNDMEGKQDVGTVEQKPQNFASKDRFGRVLLVMALLQGVAAAIFIWEKATALPWP
jgi:hypothetical protein